MHWMTILWVDLAYSSRYVELFFSFFRKVMSSPALVDNCQCWGDCESNQYTYSVSTTILEPEIVCKQSERLFSDPEYVGPPMLMRNFETMVSDVAMGNYEVCRRSIGSIAFVRFQLAGQTAMQFKKELRVTFADQISNFGKSSSRRVGKTRRLSSSLGLLS